MAAAIVQVAVPDSFLQNPFDFGPEPPAVDAPLKDSAEQLWFEDVCAALADFKKQQFRIGDLLLYGHNNFDVDIPQGGGHYTLPKVAKATGYDESTLQDYRRVARAFPLPTRVGSLSWHHHQVVAADRFTPEQRDDLLNDAVAFNLTSKQLSARAKECFPAADSIPDTVPDVQIRLNMPRKDYWRLERAAIALKTTPEKLAIDWVLGALEDTPA
ncbi:MAG: hypothetical protein WA734_00265 [Candidatus Acidiferrales bacterium]